MHSVRIAMDGQSLSVPAGTPIEAILGAARVHTERIVGALLDNHLVSLSTSVDGDARLRPVIAGSAEGEPLIRRAACLVLHAAAARRYPHLRIAVGQSLLGGYFYEVSTTDGAPPPLETLAATLTEDIEALCAGAHPLVTSTIPVEAAAYALTAFSTARERLLRAWVAPLLSVIHLGTHTDLSHGPYPPSTAAASGAHVIAYPPGLLLLFPGASAPTTPEAGRRVWEAYRETRDWNRTVGVASVGDLNMAALEDRFGETVRVAEALHEKKIAEIADRVASRPELRCVCIAGPSSSGKTTFGQRLSVQLRVNGIEPVVLNLDDYYRDRAAMTPEPDGELDFEAVDALDLPLLRAQLTALAGGEAVLVPRFDFVAQRRADPSASRTLQLGPGRVLLLEGIHGLNPHITDALPAAMTFKVFVSAMTQLVVDEHTRLTTTESRLLRRLVRDRRYRNTTAADTIARWPSVRRGEERHIFPFQESADVVFNSALVYETSVLRTFAWRFLLEVPRTHPSRQVAYQLLRLIEMFIPVLPDDVPPTSVLREFIGGSAFSY